MISEPPNIFGTIYRFDEGGPIRQSGDGYDRTFAEPVLSEMRCWSPDQVFVIFDKDHSQVVYGHLVGEDMAAITAYHLEKKSWSAVKNVRVSENVSAT